ncbi:MAG: TatD family hydrolase [Bdellovibrionales bacterium]|nr:TatD family hydrolase [Bdellovibrionales bacterium]
MELNPAFHSDEVKNTGWIDIHCHLNFLEVSPEQALQEAEAVGVQKLITIGTEPKDLEVVLELADRLSPKVFCTLGIHPHEAKLYTSEIRDYLIQHLPSPRVVAVGEIGLDFYYNNSPKDVQVQAFREQMEIAQTMNLPVQIHTRDAEPETIEILKDFSGKVRGIIHCFTGTEALGRAALDCGFNISFSGIVTFKNAQDLRDVASFVPVDRMHVETDSPFLSPIPLRGKKNQPAHMLWTAQKLCEIKNLDIPTFCNQMKLNAEKMFPRILGRN